MKETNCITVKTEIIYSQVLKKTCNFFASPKINVSREQEEYCWDPQMKHSFLWANRSYEMNSLSDSFCFFLSFIIFFPVYLVYLLWKQM